MGFGDQRKSTPSTQPLPSKQDPKANPLVFFPSHLSPAEGKPDRIGGSWQLRRISSVIVNGDADNVHTLYQRDTHKGVILSTPLKLPLKKGRNTLTVGGLYNGVDYHGADLEKVVVYPPEGKCDKWWGC